MTEIGPGNARERISVVTPTFRRPQEVGELLTNLAGQTHLPHELIVVDGAPFGEDSTLRRIEEHQDSLPFTCRYVRHGGGTAIQRNVGIERAEGEFVAFIDDDVRLDREFFTRMLTVFRSDDEREVGGVLGFRTNEHFEREERMRWRWYRRLRLLTVFEGGRYDYRVGYPVNIKLQSPFAGVREVDFISSACAVWRRRVFDEGISFDPFFADFGVLEDAHMSLRAGRKWRLLLCGDARCLHLASQRSRTDRRSLGRKSVINYWFVFRDLAGPLSPKQQLRFWSFQIFEVFRLGVSGARRRRLSDLDEMLGKVQGMARCLRGLRATRG